MTNDEYLMLGITYNVVSGEFKIEGDIKPECYIDIIDSFLSTQVGAGEDTRKAKEQDVYHVAIKWYPSDDRFVACSDTGNKGIRDGILLDVAKRLIRKAS